MIINLKNYKKYFEGISKDSNANSLLNIYRKNTLDKLDDSFEFPNYRYSSFVNLSLPDFSLSLPGDSDSEMKKSNENFDKIKINNTNDIDSNNEINNDISFSDDFDKFMFDKVSSFVENERSELDTFHDSVTDNVKIIKIPSNLVKKDSIVIDIDSIEKNSFHSLFIYLGTNSSVKIIIKQKGTSDFISSRLRVIMGEGSSLDLIQIINLDESVVYFGKNDFFTGKSSSIKFSSFSLGGKYIKSDSISNLIGEGSSSNLTVLYLSKKKELQNILVESRHIGKNTYSDIFTKGAIGDTSKSLCIGNIYIGQDAFSSNGYETQNALLLSQKAEADAIPNLEIHNHDVKCSHGSTIGQIDKDLVFYMMSRGITKKSAENLIVQGFFKPIIDSIKDETLENELDIAVKSAL